MKFRIQLHLTLINILYSLFRTRIVQFIRKIKCNSHNMKERKKEKKIFKLYKKW